MSKKKIVLLSLAYYCITTHTALSINAAYNTFLFFYSGLSSLQIAEATLCLIFTVSNWVAIVLGQIMLWRRERSLDIAINWLCLYGFVFTERFLTQYSSCLALACVFVSALFVHRITSFSSLDRPVILVLDTAAAVLIVAVLVMAQWAGTNYYICLLLVYAVTFALKIAAFIARYKNLRVAFEKH